MPYYLFCRFSSVQHSRKYSSTRHYSHFPLCTGRRNMVSIDFVSSENYTTCIIYTHTHTHTHIYIHTHTYTHPVASAMSDSLWPHELKPTRLLCPWDSPGKNTGVGCHIHTHTHTHMKIYYISKHWKMCLFVSYLRKTLQYKARYLKKKIITPLGIIQHPPKQHINFK